MSDLAFTPDEPQRRGPRALYVFLIVVAIALIAAFVVTAAFFHLFTIPSESMAPTLTKGDMALVRRSGAPPARGDVIIYLQPRDNRTSYIKRVIGLPGERIQITDGKVYVNGKAWDRVRLADATEKMGGWSRPVQRYRETNADGRVYVVNDYGPDGDLDNTEVYTVPPGHYFVMGDNRDNSLDSRVPADQGGGFVPARNVVGKVVLILGDKSDRPNGMKP